MKAIVSSNEYDIKKKRLNHYWWKRKMNQMKGEMRLVTNESRTTSFDMVSHPTMPFPTQKTSTKPVNHLDGESEWEDFYRE